MMNFMSKINPLASVFNSPSGEARAAPGENATTPLPLS
jgi:hypothetical protein